MHKHVHRLTMTTIIGFSSVVRQESHCIIGRYQLGVFIDKGCKDSFLCRDGTSASKHTSDLLPQGGNSGGVLVQRDCEPCIHAIHIKGGFLRMENLTVDFLLVLH